MRKMLAERGIRDQGSGIRGFGPGPRPLTPVPFFLAIAIAACGGGKGPTPLVLYSTHGRDQLTAMEKAFEAQNPDIDVRWLDMGSQDAFDRVRSEKANPQG